MHGHLSQESIMSLLECDKPKDEQTRFVPEPPRLRKLPKESLMWLTGKIGAGLHRTLGHRAGDSLGILMFHRVWPRVPGLPFPLHNVEPHRFREQLGGLLRRGYEFWALRKVLEYRCAGELVPPRTVVVTFDDGFQSVYTHAWPALKEFQIPATVFVNTAYLDSDEPFPFDAWGVECHSLAPRESYRPLTSDQCREMIDSGLIEIGAHTHSHEDFRGRPDEFRDDLQLSVDIVRERFGLDEVTFAFPYGSPHSGFAGGQLADAARETGVACALTTEPVLVDPSSDPFHWGRFNAFSWDTSATLAGKLGGWYSWAPKLRQSLARVIKGRAKDSLGQAARLSNRRESIYVNRNTRGIDSAANTTFTQQELGQ